MQYSMKTLPEAERPYEKCLAHGPAHLSDAELLAVILRTGSVGESALELARRILYDPAAAPDEGLKRLVRGQVNEWMHLKGIGQVKAVQLVCLAELSRRISQSPYCDRLALTSPSTVAENYMEELRHQCREVVKVIFLDTKSKRLGECDISKGTVNASLISPREIYMEAMRYDAVFVMILHNHPSGDPTPSKADRDLTKRLAYTGLMLGIPLIDHIVIGDRCYFSFEEHGLISKDLGDYSGEPYG